MNKHDPACEMITWTAEAIRSGQAQSVHFELDTLIHQRMMAFDAKVSWMIDEFRRCMLWSGYKPEECAIVEHLNADGSIKRRVLIVCGRECFEVAMTTSTSERYIVTLTATPRVIEWPPRRGMPSEEVLALLERGV